MGAFRKGNVPLMVATDVAARGLDIKDINYVINFDFPMQIQDYIHRIGRTGRAGNFGMSHSFLTSEDQRHAEDLQKVLIHSYSPYLQQDLNRRQSGYPNRTHRTSQGKAIP